MLFDKDAKADAHLCTEYRYVSICKEYVHYILYVIICTCMYVHIYLYTQNYEVIAAVSWTSPHIIMYIGNYSTGAVQNYDMYVLLLPVSFANR